MRGEDVRRGLLEPHPTAYGLGNRSSSRLCGRRKRGNNSTATARWSRPMAYPRLTFHRNRPAATYLQARSRCLHPGQQQGRRWPSCSYFWVRRMRRSRMISCLASSTQQMNSLRAKGMTSLQVASAVAFGDQRPALVYWLARRFCPES